MKRRIALNIVTLSALLAPLAAGAAFPGDGSTGILPNCGRGGVECGFEHLIQLLRNIMNWLIIMSVPLAALSFAYAGWLYISAGGNSGQVSKAHGIFTNVAIGFSIVLAAWLIVYAVAKALLKDSFLTVN